ncbi:bifunctional 2-polyprenyl-6-hydroxyphenol methylase/3-demethylubiquinol 3-O-methyltransferase UbiG [Streptomyces sp. WAC06614]|uniref:class I SAM-dependent methyltransferase n=1 Tax=Streptomyces sp. WAC06614 TaxID=2487416 RepID=UPI000F7881C1|nr:class I SAM-dependent methyltransferase [Streptomyces sp. WAC06614]RSS78991.1 class I SAM-dependent methyltransferase [Streptomyces sp. WAC06614]
MLQQYDTLGERFEPFVEQSVSAAAFCAADTFTLLGELDALGGVKGLDALDLACGFGYYTRLLARAGARRTVGVDVSGETIRLARTRPEGTEGIEFVVADAAALPRLGPFDLVTAVYLFNHAPDRAALRAMFAGIRDNLRPGGRLLAVVPNPGAYPHVDWSPFGVRILDRVREQDADAPLLRALYLTEPPVPFEFREWPHAEYGEAAVLAGFTSIAWHPTRTPPPCAARDEAYWASYRSAPVSSLLTCVA